MFYEETKPNTIKKELKIDISLTFDESHNGPTIYPTLKIGDTRLYNLKNKMREFFNTYDGYNEKLEFGKELPDKIENNIYIDLTKKDLSSRIRKDKKENGRII